MPSTSAVVYGDGRDFDYGQTAAAVEMIDRQRGTQQGISRSKLEEKGIDGLRGFG